LRLRLLPENRSFYDQFRRQASLVVKGAEQLLHLVEHYEHVPIRAGEIKETEHEGDVVAHEIIASLHQTFITPLDRDDIYALTARLDDILDYVEEVAASLDRYKIDRPSDALRRSCGLLLDCVRLLEKAVGQLESRDGLKESWPAIHNIENEADQVYLNAIALLLNDDTASAAFIIKWKNLYDALEEAIDRCEDTANVLESIHLKYN